MAGHSEAGQLRPLSAQVGLLSRPDGSAMINQGDTSVTAAVYGPAEVKISRELVDQATVDVVYRPKSGMPGCAEKFHERVIRNTCQTVVLASLHPRTSISIIVQEMQNLGGHLACCINASCLALLDAGVPLKFMTAAVNCMVDKEGCVILDPTSKQTRDKSAELTIAFDSTDYKVISTTMTGQMDNNKLNECITVCREASKDIVEFFRESMRQKLLRTV